MAKNAKKFLEHVLGHASRFQKAKKNDSDKAYAALSSPIQNEIVAKGEYIFAQYTADEEAPIPKYDDDYDDEDHTSYAEYVYRDVGWVEGLIKTDAEDGTAMGRELHTKITKGIGAQLSPGQVYGGCSSKSLIELLGKTSEVANDANAWENLQAQFEEGSPKYDLIEAIWKKDTAGIGADSYGRGAIPDEAGFNPCDPNAFSEEAYKKWIAGHVQAQFAQQYSQVVIAKIRDDNTGTWGGMSKADETNFLSGSTQALKEIAAYTRVDNIKFKEQCFLLSNISILSQVKKSLEVTVPKKKPDNTAAGNACVQLQGDPFGLINKLTQNAHKEEFFDMPTAALSSLQPMIRLYKVVADDNGKNERQVEVKFDSHYSTEDAKDLLTNKANRGHGVGISSFNCTYEGNNPQSIKKSIRAKLVIHANNFSELLRDRNGTVDPSKNGPYAPPGSPVPYRYIDLAMKTWDPDGATRDMNKINPQQREVVQKNMDKLTFRLKAVLGWANPSAKTTKTSRGTWAATTGGRITPNILDAVYDSCITLSLTPTVHTFDIDEMGRVKFTLNYFAYVEDFFDNPSFNIFTNPEVVIKQVARKVRYKKLSEDCDSKEVNEIKNSESAAKEIEEEKIKNFRYLMKSMLKNKKMRFMEIPIEDLSKYRQGGPIKQVDPALVKKFVDSVKTAEAGGAGSGAVARSINEQVDKGVAEATSDKKKTTDPTDPGDDTKAKSGSTGTVPTPSQVEAALNPLQTVTFFWVSDLMDVILQCIGETLSGLPDKIKNMDKMKDEEYKEFLLEEVRDYTRYAENFAKYRLTLGPLELLNANKKGKVVESAFVNLGDVPISAKYFMEFLTTKVLKTDRQAYSLPKFLNDFFTQLLSDFLNNDTCYGNRAKQKTRLGQAAITSYKKKAPLDNITAAMGSASRLDITNYSGEQLPVLDVFGERGSPVSSKDVKDETHFMVFYAARTQPTDLMTGCKGGKKHKCYDSEGVEILGDHDRGLWHYQIGKDRGIVKTIQLEKTDSPGLAEVRFEQEGYDGLAQLRVLYDAKIKTYLDVNAYPGSYIYVEPRGFDPGASSTDLTRMGVGGYYMIIRSSHTIGPGIAETEISAKWVAEVEKNIEEKGKADEKPKEKKGKCYSGGGERKTAAMDQGLLASLGIGDMIMSYDPFGINDKKEKDDGTKKPS